MTQEHGMDLIQQQIAQGQFFLAYDTYRLAVEAGEGGLRMTLLGALALLRSGAVAEASRLLAPLAPQLESRSLRRERLGNALQQAMAQAGLAQVDPTALNQAMDHLMNELSQAQHGEQAPSGADSPEVLRLVSEVHLELWLRLRHPADLRRALQAAEKTAQQTAQPTTTPMPEPMPGHLATRGTGLTDLLQVARLAALSQHTARAQHVAQAVAQRLALLPAPGPATDAATAFRHHARQAEVAVLLNQATELTTALGEIARIQPRPLPGVVALLRQLDMLEQANLPLAASARAQLAAPSLVVFAGQALDAPGCPQPSFPPELEASVYKKIAEKLGQISAEVGFCSASAGAELLFVEAMLDRGAEVHLFLPFSQADFIRHRVAYAGARWERRFHSACKLATSITYSTDEAFLGHEALLRFNNHQIQGMALAQAQLHLTHPHLLVLWDHAAAGGAGSAADFMDSWSDTGSLHLIDLDELRDHTPPPHHTPGPTPPPPVPPLVPLQPERRIRTMLFADIVGYSKLKEQDLPQLWRCLEGVTRHLAASAPPIQLIESWGDAIYAVTDNSMDMAAYALALIDAVAALGTADGQLSQPLQVRIGLHAGPVFEGVHPFTGRPIVYGGHVSRAARIEPVSLPGHAYASQQFVAMLLSEESAQAHKAHMTGQLHEHRHDCEYLGNLSLAKDFGRQSVYHLRNADKLVLTPDSPLWHPPSAEPLQPTPPRRPNRSARPANAHEITPLDTTLERRRR